MEPNFKTIRSTIRSIKLNYKSKRIYAVIACLLFNFSILSPPGSSPSSATIVLKSPGGCNSFAGLTSFSFSSVDYMIAELYKKIDTSDQLRGGALCCGQTIVSAVPAQILQSGAKQDAGLIPAGLYELDSLDFMPEQLKLKGKRKTISSYEFLERFHDRELGNTFLLAGIVEGLGKLIKDDVTLPADVILTSILGGNVFGIRDVSSAVATILEEDPNIMQELGDRVRCAQSASSSDEILRQLAPHIEEYQVQVKRMREVMDAWKACKINMLNNTTQSNILLKIKLIADWANNVKHDSFVGFDLLKDYIGRMYDNFSINKDMASETLAYLCKQYGLSQPDGGVTEWLDIQSDGTSINGTKLTEAIWSTWKPDDKKLKEYMRLLQIYLPTHYDTIIDLTASQQVAGHTFTPDESSKLNKKIKALNANKKKYDLSLYEYNESLTPSLFARGAFFNHNLTDTWFNEYLTPQFDKIICGQIGEMQRNIVKSYLALLCHLFGIQINSQIPLSALSGHINFILKDLYNTPLMMLKLRNEALIDKLKNVWLSGALTLSTEYKIWLKKMTKTKFTREFSAGNAPLNSLMKKKWFAQLKYWYESADSDSKCIKNLAAYFLFSVYKDMIFAGLDTITQAKGGGNQIAILNTLITKYLSNNVNTFINGINSIGNLTQLSKEQKDNIANNLWDFIKRFNEVSRYLYPGVDILELLQGKLGRDKPQPLPDSLKSAESSLAYNSSGSINVVDSGSFHVRPNAGAAPAAYSGSLFQMLDSTNSGNDQSGARDNSPFAAAHECDDPWNASAASVDLTSSFKLRPIARRRGSSVHGINGGLGGASPTSPGLKLTSPARSNRNSIFAGVDNDSLGTPPLHGRRVGQLNTPKPIGVLCKDSEGAVNTYSVYIENEDGFVDCTNQMLGEMIGSPLYVFAPDQNGVEKYFRYSKEQFGDLFVKSIGGGWSKLASSPGSVNSAKSSVSGKTVFGSSPSSTHVGSSNPRVGFDQNRSPIDEENEEHSYRMTKIRSANGSDIRSKCRVDNVRQDNDARSSMLSSKQASPLDDYVAFAESSTDLPVTSRRFSLDDKQAEEMMQEDELMKAASVVAAADRLVQEFNRRTSNATQRGDS